MQHTLPINPETSQTIRQIYTILLYTYGEQNWWPAITNLDVCIGAILTQNTSWNNAERVMNALRMMGLLSIGQLDNISILALESAIRPSGTYRNKARKIKAFIQYLVQYWDGNLNTFLSVPKDLLRDELLCIYGIGQESADAIVLYAAGKASFVIDAYTRRIFDRIGLLGDMKSYNSIQNLFHRALGFNVKTFKEYHALIVQHGKTICTKENPRCIECSLLKLCQTGSHT